MVIEHLILAHNSAVDIDRNTLSVFDFIEDIHVEAPPGGAVPIPAQVVAVIKRENETGDIRTTFVISFSGPAGLTARHEIPVHIPEKNFRQRLRINTNIPVTTSGVYSCRLEKIDQPALSRDVAVRVTTSLKGAKK